MRAATESLRTGAAGLRALLRPQARDVLRVDLRTARYAQRAFVSACGLSLLCSLPYLVMVGLEHLELVPAHLLAGEGGVVAGASLALGELLHLAEHIVDVALVPLVHGMLVTEVALSSALYTTLAHHAPIPSLDV